MADLENCALPIAWNRTQGNFSENVAGKILKFEKLQNLSFETVLDLCCGTANLLSVMKEAGKICTGTETSEEFCYYCQTTYPELNVVKVENLYDFSGLGQFDLITCTHDIINTIPDSKKLESFLSSVYEHLTNGGVFIFDYYTATKLRDWREQSFTEYEGLDTFKEISTKNGVTTITNTYYISAASETGNPAKVKKVEDEQKKHIIDDEKLRDALKSSKYRYMIKTDANFTPLSEGEDVNRMYIIAIKRENVIKK